MPRDDRKAKDVERALRLTWSSLESHLRHTHGKKDCRRCDDKRFHRQCVKEYAELIAIIGRLA